MTSQNTLEIKGSLHVNPLAELLAETFQANLSGSLRLSGETGKVVVYLNGGEVVFAVSNARRHRLFETLLQTGRIDKNRLAEIPNFTSDIELGERLKADGVFSKAEMDDFFSVQTEEILKTALAWTAGEWIFSAQMRIKENIHFKIELQRILLEYAGNLPNNFVAARFKSFNETFGANPSANLNLDLTSEQAFVLSRFEKSFLKIQDIKSLSGLSEILTLKILYGLWLGGFLYRENWNQAISDRKISEINQAKLHVKKEETTGAVEPTARLKVHATPVQPAAPAALPTVDIQPVMAVEEYLARAENADTFYEFLDIRADAELSDIKQAYFALAKQFHPDKYHQEKNSELLRRIQDAFTQAAQAYETLKNPDARKVYDYKMSKQPASLKSRDASGGSAKDVKERQAETAKDSFEEGFKLLMRGDFDESLPFLARAVQAAPDNARYHAFYGKALSGDETQRYKADAEMQAAVRLEPQNPTFRIILAEFYIQFELFRRAEGELQRLLAIHPNHREALDLLDSLPKK